MSAWLAGNQRHILQRKDILVWQIFFLKTGPEKIRYQTRRRRKC